MKQLAKEYCTGCGACENICPIHCIEIVEYDEYISAEIHEELCIDCNKCMSVCPVLKKQYPKAYAAYALSEEILRKSSSGGIATLLAERILEHGGVVFGVAFNEEFKVCHVVVEEKRDLYKIRGSKYVQSRVGKSYEKVECFLKEKREVLFTGTSCQISGLYNYLEAKCVDTAFLYTQDIICHGVVLPRVWDKYLEGKELEYGSRVTDVSFRNKKNGWLNFCVNICFENGQIYNVDNKDDLYMQIFLSDIALNESCYNCSFRGERHCSDITLADFWSVYRNQPESFNENGTSLVLVNSFKGQKLLENITSQIYIKEVAVSAVTRSEIMLVTTVKKHVNRERFLHSLNEETLENCFRKYVAVRFGVMGSYNSRCIAKRCGDVIFQVSNTNLISLFSEPIIGHKLEVKNNQFREEMLKLDFNKKFILEFEKFVSDVDYLIIDFLEERFGVVAFDGTYVANSDALKDSGIMGEQKEVLKVYDKEYFEKWKESCIRFLDMVIKSEYKKNIILINMYLSEKDSEGNVFVEVDEIKKINCTLKEMYAFFEESCKAANIKNNFVKISDVLFYTNKNHKYGCYPEHSNTRAELMGATILEGIISNKVS